MITEADLLAGIVQQPRELDRWLVLADWLEERDDPRAELARLRYHLHTEPGDPQRLARQLALLDAGLSPVVPTWTNDLGMTFALILPGTFQMGSPETEAGRYGDEELHAVTLTEPYLLGVYPVTVDALQHFTETAGYQTEGERNGDGTTWRYPGFEPGGRHPAACISWNDAQALVQWLNERAPESGCVYALPTEAQWEYACRAGTQTAYWWGDDAQRLGDHAWFEDNAEHSTHPVETKLPNPWGLWHLHGHVWEWCQDRYAHRTEDEDEEVDTDPAEEPRVLRGGGWYGEARLCRAADRVSNDPTTRYTGNGVRLAVRSIPAWN